MSKEYVNPSGLKHHGEKILETVDKKIKGLVSEESLAETLEGYTKSDELPNGYDDTALSNRVTAIEEDYLTSDDKAEITEAIATAKSEAIETVLGQAVNEDFDTLKEVADWIQADTTGSAELVTRVNNIENDYVKNEDIENFVTETELEDNYLSKSGGTFKKGSSINIPSISNNSHLSVYDENNNVAVKIVSDELLLDNPNTNETTSITAGGVDTPEVKTKKISMENGTISMPSTGLNASIGIKDDYLTASLYADGLYIEDSDTHVSTHVGASMVNSPTVKAMDVVTSNLVGLNGKSTDSIDVTCQLIMGEAYASNLRANSLSVSEVYDSSGGITGDIDIFAARTFTQELQGTKITASKGFTGDLTGKVNGYTVNSNVPADAKFTDNNTTYSLTKSGTTITLTGSDGSKTTVEDSEGVKSSVYQDKRILLQIDGGTATGYDYSIHCGLNNKITGNCSIGAGSSNTVSTRAIVCGSSNNVNSYGISCGSNNTTGNSSITGGNNNTYNSNCIGYLAVGEYNNASQHSIVGGIYNSFNNACGMAIGLYGTTPEAYSHVSYFGSNRDNSTAFLIGNGTNSARGNGFRITFNGNAYGKEFVSSGADYAEFISEWADGNPNAEDRVGYMVTIKDNKLYKANEGDYIVGITSGNPSVVGNGDETYFWKYERDEFNRFVYVDTEIPAWVKQTDEEGNEILDENGEPIWIESDIETTTIKALKLANNYDPNQEYTPRKDRPEWDYIGMIGVVPVRDDGTCEVGGFCKCGVEGIATATTEKTFGSYFVKERISENVISVVLN